MEIKKNSEGASTDGGDYDKIRGEIEGAVEQVVKDASTDGGEEPKDEPKDPVPAAPEPAPDEQPDKGGDDAFTVGDAEIERAVKAGLSVADARSFKDKGAFERVVSALEKKAGTPPKDTASTEQPDGGDGEEDSADDDIPTLPENEDYDEKLVKVVNSLGKMVKDLRTENRKLREAGKAATEQSFFDSQYDGLDDAVRTKAGEAGKAKVQAKFKMLEAGYKAMKAEISREDIFKEAAELAIGDVLRENAAASKAAKIDGRKNLRLAQPSGENRGGTAKRTEEDELRDVARLVSDKFHIPAT